jgi:hypothetical protein
MPGSQSGFCPANLATDLWIHLPSLLCVEHTAVSLVFSLENKGLLVRSLLCVFVRMCRSFSVSEETDRSSRNLVWTFWDWSSTIIRFNYYYRSTTWRTQQFVRWETLTPSEMYDNLSFKSKLLYRCFFLDCKTATWRLHEPIFNFR